MLDASGQTCTACTSPLERVRYFPRQLITADDMRTEQHYFRERLKRHNRFLHGFGVVCGCTVIATPTEPLPWAVTICPGYAVSPHGDEILIPDPVIFDLQTGVQNPETCTPLCPCPPMSVCNTTDEQKTGFLCVRYAECVSRPVRVHPAGCGCDQLDCEYSRIRDSFELKLLWSPPASHTAAQVWETTWRTALANQRELFREKGLSVPPCMPCSEDGWVVLAVITIPPRQGSGAAAKKTPIAPSNLDVRQRRVLYSTEALQVMTEVLAGM